MLERLIKVDSRIVLNEKPTLAHNMSSFQVSAIRAEAKLGDQIRRDYAQIAAEYRAGLTAPKLVEKYSLDVRFGVKLKAATAAVRNAIRGYNGGFSDSYDGLIPIAAERAKIALAHNRLTGIEAFQKKRGIHSLTNEQKVEAGRKGGLISGPLSFRLHIGCHALPAEILREHCRLIAPLGGQAGGRAGALAKGLTLYVQATDARCSEMEFAVRLANDPAFLGPLRANFNKIAATMNQVFTDHRPPYTRITLKIALQHYRRQGHSTELLSCNREMSSAEKLTADPFYQIAPRMRAEQIARRVNDEYHGGRQVRNSVSIRAAIKRYRRQLADCQKTKI